MRSSENNFDFLTLLKISIRSNNFNIQENLNRNFPCHWLQYGSSLLLYCSWYSLSLFSGIFKKYYCTYKKTYIIYFWKLSVIFPGFSPFIFYLPSSQFLIQQFSVFLLQKSNSSFGPFFLLQSFPSNICFDSASAFHFAKICHIHGTLEAFLQKNPFCCPWYIQTFFFFWPCSDTLST